eukprot:5649801-Pleurochrysis_carterae.AAC.1
MSNCSRHCIAHAQRRLADVASLRRRHRCDKGLGTPTTAGVQLRVFQAIYTLRRCACVRERALRAASRPLPALACAADDLEWARFSAKTDLDAQEVWY